MADEDGRGLRLTYGECLTHLSHHDPRSWPTSISLELRDRRYISLIGAPNLHSGDAPDHPTYDNSSSGSGSGSGGHGYIWPDGLSGQNFRNNFGPDFTET